MDVWCPARCRLAVQTGDPVYVYTKPAKYRIFDRFRKKADRNIIYQQCLERLKKKQSLGIFPEGSRNRDPDRLKKGKRGLAEIVFMSGVSVLPVGIDFPARRKKKKIPRFGPLIIRIGKKIEFSEETEAYHRIIKDEGMPLPEKQRRIHHLCQRVVHRVMSDISGLCGKDSPYSAPEIVPGLVRNYIRREKWPRSFP